MIRVPHSCISWQASSAQQLYYLLNCVCVCVWKEQNCIMENSKGKVDRVRKKGMLATFHYRGRHFLSLCCSLQVVALFTGTSHNSQDVEEDVDDVSVKVEGSKYVLLWTQGQLLVAQEKLSVDSQKLQKTNKDGIRHFKRFIHQMYPYTITMIYP